MWEAWRQASAGGPAGAAQATAAFRAAKDDLFRLHPQSPLPIEGRGPAFGGLAYWPYDPALRLTARLQRLQTAPAQAPNGPTSRIQTIDLKGGSATELQNSAAELPNSGDEPLSFRRIGYVTLPEPLGGRRLSVFWIEGYAGGLFLPFRDATGGAETYAAGRYLLDTIKGADQGQVPATGELILDFNMAYFPSCAYDPRWSCPLAPVENVLDLPVRAGERLPA